MAGDLDCDTLINASPVVNEWNDVSGDPDGVRIEWTDGECSPWAEFLGAGCPSVVEQHFPGIHQTWYADLGGDMFDLEGNVVGNCVVDIDTDKYCDVTAGRSRYQRLLNCEQYI